MRVHTWLMGLVLALTAQVSFGQAPGQFVEITSLPAAQAGYRVANQPAPPAAMNYGGMAPIQRYENAPVVRYQPTTVYRPPLLPLGRSQQTAAHPVAYQNAMPMPYQTVAPVAYPIGSPIAHTGYPQVTTLHPIPVGTTVYSPVGAPTCGLQPTGGFAYAPAGVPAPNSAPYRPIVSLSSPPVNYQVGQGLWGQPKLYMPSQPVRNFIRYLSP